MTLVTVEYVDAHAYLSLQGGCYLSVGKLHERSFLIKSILYQYS